MSLLLDALKKSEQQRRLGAQPDIHREAAPTPQSDAATARLWLPLALVVLAVLAISWFGWRQFRAPEPSTAVAEVADATLTAPATAERTDSAEGAAATPAARTPIESFTAPQAAAADSPARQDPAAAQARQQALQSFSEYKEPETPPASAAAATSPAPDVPAASAPAAKPDPQPTAKPASKPAAAASPAAQPNEPYEPEPMSYWALPQGVRDTLPAFRVSVLVYADDPADRFVLVNGVRLREKQELQTGVVLDEIRRDGAVFRARNYRFLVKG